MASYLPSSLASAAALAGLVTAVKSSWELSRMIKKKYEQRVLKVMPMKSTQASQGFARWQNFSPKL